MWAGAVDTQFLRFRRTLSGDSLDCSEYIIDAYIDHPIEDIPAIPPVLDQSSFTQYRQLLLDISLAKAKVRFHMADAVFPIP